MLWGHSVNTEHGERQHGAQWASTLKQGVLKLNAVRSRTAWTLWKFKGSRDFKRGPQAWPRRAAPTKAARSSRPALFHLLLPSWHHEIKARKPRPRRRRLCQRRAAAAPRSREGGSARARGGGRRGDARGEGMRAGARRGASVQGRPRSGRHMPRRRPLPPAARPLRSGRAQPGALPAAPTLQWEARTCWTRACR